MLAEPDYPSRLQMIGDPPPVVALRGKLEVLKQTLIAIVGSRNASAAGVKFAERMARDLGEAGFATGRRWPAESTPRRTAPAFQQELLPCSPAVTAASNPPNTSNCWTKFW